MTGFMSDMDTFMPFQNENTISVRKRGEGLAGLATLTAQVASRTVIQAVRVS